MLRNPNKPDPLAGLDLELTGDLADKVTLLVEKVINPSLASHGGFARWSASRAPGSSSRWAAGARAAR